MLMVTVRFALTDFATRKGKAWMGFEELTLIIIMWRIGLAHNNARK